MTDRPTTEAGRALLEVHRHLAVSGDEDDWWCRADDEPWPCPFVEDMARVETQARTALIDELVAAVERLRIYGLASGSPIQIAQDEGYNAALAAALRILEGARHGPKDTWCREHKAYDECPENCPRCRSYWHGSTDCILEGARNGK